MTDPTVFEHKTAAYYTLGCKLNFTETSTIGRSLLEQGVRTAREGERADICVINTCSVTEMADRKCRNIIRKAHREHPKAFIIVTGCYAQLSPEEVARIDGVNLVLGTEQKLDMNLWLERLSSETPPRERLRQPRRQRSRPSTEASRRTNALVTSSKFRTDATTIVPTAPSPEPEDEVETPP